MVAAKAVTLVTKMGVRSVVAMGLGQGHNDTRHLRNHYLL